MRTYHDIPRPGFTPERITELKADEVFVFGSNLAGMHGGGAAWIAYERFGAVMGQGVGLQGQSYAIPTMEGIAEMSAAIQRFTLFAAEHSNMRFLVTRIGCGIAGFTADGIAPLFMKAIDLENVILPQDFVEVLTK